MRMDLPPLPDEVIPVPKIPLLEIKEQGKDEE